MAIQAKPDFEVALVNLANALNDSVGNFSPHDLDKVCSRWIPGKI